MRTRNQLKILLAVILVLINLLPFVPLQSAKADTATLNVNAEGAETSGTYINYWTMVPVGDFNNVVSNDQLTLYIESVNNHSWNLSNTAFSASSISSITIHSLGYSPSLESGYKMYVRISGVNYYSDSFFSASNTDQSYTLNNNPATGTAWTTTVLDNMEIGIRQWDSFSRPSYLNYIYVTVTYTASTAPTMSTQPASSIAYSTNHTATLNGTITSTGGTYPSIRGFVYDTSTHSDPGNISPAASAYTSNTTESGNFTTGAYTRNIQSLTKNTTYYVRACAYNAYGWVYGDEITFTTLGDPSITTSAASSISATTARLNASVVNSGGQLADVKFGYGTATGNMSTYSTNTTLVENTYTTGTMPYADITGLTANTTYYFRAWINNDVSSSNGTELSFNTTSSIAAPTTITANPSDTSVSLTWVKGSGSSDTLIVYKTSGYPTSKTDGTTGYNGTATSYTISGLTSGTTYYFMAWGKSGTTYSSSNASVLSTTVAGTNESPIFTGYATPTLWFQSPDYTKMSQFPLYGLFNWWSDCFQMPRSTFWFLLAMMFAIAMGVLIYSMSHNIIMGSVTVTICVVVVSIMGLMSYWMLLPFIIATVTIIMVGQRA